MRSRRQIQYLVVAALMGALLACVQPVVAAADDDWYVITMAGSPIGSIHTVLKRNDNDQVETQAMRVVLNRLGNRVEVASTIATREDNSGRLLGLDMKLDTSAQATSMQAVAEPGRVKITHGAGEATFHREIEYTGELLGPAGIRELIRTSLKEVGDKASYKTFRADLGIVLELEVVLMAVENDLHRIDEKPNGISAGMYQWRDRQGKIVRSVAPSPFGPMETVLADAAAAKSATAGNQLPEESYKATLARMQVRLLEPRRSRRVVLEIRSRNPLLGWPELAAPGQTVLKQDPDRLLLEVRKIGSLGPAQFPVEVTEETRECLEANAYIESNDPKVRARARKIVGDTTEILTAMQALERWTAENMTFDLGVVLAPSSEVLENRKGTCTGYAILLTTLARSLGIPARFVMGYVYVGGIYAGHAWCEVLVGDQWVGFDAAVPAESPVDAARIGFLWSSLAEGLGGASLALGLQMYGQIDLAVLEYELDEGNTRRYSLNEQAFAVDDHNYLNHSLNVSWRKPANYSFVNLDRVWPDAGLVSIESPDGTRATLSVRDRRRYWLDANEEVRSVLKRAVPGETRIEIEVNGRKFDGVESENQAATAMIRGSEIWLLEVESHEAGNALRDLASGLKLW